MNIESRIMIFLSNSFIVVALQCIFLLNNIFCVSCEDIPVTNRTSFLRCNWYSRNQCSMESFAGGGAVVPKQFPHMALIGYMANDGQNISWQCTGSLLNGFHVLTSAHCVQHYFLGRGNTFATHVMLGELNLQSTDDDAQPQIFNISKIIVHPNYRNDSAYDDIALIRLGFWAEYNDYIRPACLFYSDTISESRAIVTGWGRINENQSETEPLLQKIEFDLQTNECEQLFANNSKLEQGIDKKTMLCGKPVTADRDACKGFAGSPLQIMHPELKCGYQIIGITSRGPPCGNGLASLFVRVSQYIDWIEDNTWPKRTGSLVWPN